MDIKGDKSLIILDDFSFLFPFSISLESLLWKTICTYDLNVIKVSKDDQQNEDGEQRWYTTTWRRLRRSLSTVCCPRKIHALALPRGRQKWGTVLLASFATKTRSENALHCARSSPLPIPLLFLTLLFSSFLFCSHFTHSILLFNTHNANQRSLFEEPANDRSQGLLSFWSSPLFFCFLFFLSFFFSFLLFFVLRTTT